MALLPNGPLCPATLFMSSRNTIHVYCSWRCSGGQRTRLRDALVDVQNGRTLGLPTVAGTPLLPARDKYGGIEYGALPVEAWTNLYYDVTQRDTPILECRTSIHEPGDHHSWRKHFSTTSSRDDPCGNSVDGMWPGSVGPPVHSPSRQHDSCSPVWSDITTAANRWCSGHRPHRMFSR
jgi:hypothetical protein